jgi:hypothetical protein
MADNLHEFIGTHYNELIARCTAKSAERVVSAAGPRATDYGVPLFLEQLLHELTDGPSQAEAIAAGARAHGVDLLRRGFTVSQVVHDYGDVCQAITELAVERKVTIETDDFRILNRCLDDAIAGAVTAHSSQVALTRHGESPILRAFLEAAITAFEALEIGGNGMSGSTGALLGRSLEGMRDYLGSTTSTA